MLRSFRVANHKSFRDEAELLLMPAYDKSRPVVPVAGIFGANASGKSNLLDALRWMQTAVRESYAQWEPGRGIPRSPFRLSAAGGQAPSHYTMEIVVDDVRHTYGFAVDNARVREEWLYVYPHGRKRVIFEREENGGWTFGTTVPRHEVEILRKLTRDNALFLSVAARSELAAVLPAYQWFQDGLAFHNSAGRPRDRDVIDWLDRSPDHRSRLVELVRMADLGIGDLTVEAPTPPPYYEQLRSDLWNAWAELEKASEANMARLAPNVRWMEAEISAIEDRDLLFLHGDPPVAMAARDQSDGTLAWIHLLTDGLRALEVGSVLCVDEIDSSLHPHLTSRLIGMFHDQEVNRRGAQLLFTTHDATLLGTSAGEDILQRDEVWFVEKERRGGASRLYPLTDFHPRKEDSAQRRYLGGSYGAVPLVADPDIREAFGLDPWGGATSATT